ncbi:DUF551 domain-containing protein [Klebsiella pneumoniae]|uniref:DUF551 domain-containing protein n=1 Tax=Klebsiella pneumoniae TaxID=573 RepID=UPI001FACD3ED|nr:DUF551 domain-containing protein [Klebsiella pneumoniae]MCI8087824.1 DUF551 domain-containing protein [Klebsiella pneumoniae]MCI8103898.1 DUF551 domain-containing protein [Klebsiella pneumoniae]
MSILTKEVIQKILNDDWLLMDDCEGLENCTVIKELARMALAAMDSEPVELPLDYLQGRKDGLEWAAQLAEANHPEKGDWLYDDPIELAKAIRKGPDMPPAQPVADSEPVAWMHNNNNIGIPAITTSQKIGQYWMSEFKDVQPLYRHAQPAPVVPDAYVRDERGRMMLNGVCEPKIGFGIGWNACRAAMLDRQLVDHVDEESLTSINPAPAMGSLSKTGEVLHTNSPAQGGNSSVIPDTWIPVSEQMPPSRHEVLVGRWWGEKPRWCCKWATYIPGHPDAQSSGWLIPGGSWTPTHWMELPAAPQEVR